MKDSEFRRFLREELRREAEKELEKVQANDRVRDLKIPEELKKQILENFLEEK